jgi:hypothetical protein
MKLSERIREAKDKRAVVPPPVQKPVRISTFENWWVLASRDPSPNGGRCEVTQ